MQRANAERRCYRCGSIGWGVVRIEAEGRSGCRRCEYVSADGTEDPRPVMAPDRMGGWVPVTLAPLPAFVPYTGTLKGST